jgi:hypothetical protein
VDAHVALLKIGFCCDMMILYLLMKGMVALRKILALLLAALLLCVPALPVFAHTGKTDANGGHYDSATGEYHYHHGYPAHSHWDMDGDGVIDCPHDFDDQTNHNDSNPTSSDDTRSDGLTYTDGYEAGYEAGYRYGKTDANMDIKDQTDKAYEEGRKQGYKEGQSDTLASIKEAEVQAKKDGVLAVLGIELAMIGPAAVLYESFVDKLENWRMRRKKKKVKSTPPKPATQPNSKPKPEPTPPKHEPFTYTPNPDPPKPPRLGPADEEFTIIRRSSFIAAVCHKNGHLYVKTTQGDYFMYYNVPKSVYLNFMNATSMGRFFNQYIANNYPFSRL